MVQKVFVKSTAKTGTQLGESMHAGENEHGRMWKDVKNIFINF